MYKVKTKKIKIDSGINDTELSEIFNQMLGTGTVNMDIAYPRYVRIKYLCEQFIKLFDLLSKSPFIGTGEFEKNKIELEKFVVDSNEMMTKLFSITLMENEWNYRSDVEKTFTEVYNNVKKSNIITLIVRTCDNLIHYKKNFIDLDNINYKFINNMAGAEWRPLPCTTLNIKYIMLSSGENTQRTIMSIISRAYEFSYKLYCEIQSPDIDIDKFVDIIMNNVDKIQSQPQLARCSKAFQKIKDSVALLKANFNDYYRDFISTKNSTIIMQHFILDVSKQSKSDPVITSQFRTIIDFYRKQAQNNINNPKIKLLFDRVNDSFKEFEKYSANIKIAEDTDST